MILLGLEPVTGIRICSWDLNPLLGFYWGPALLLGFSWDYNLLLGFSWDYNLLLGFYWAPALLLGFSWHYNLLLGFSWAPALLLGFSWDRERILWDFSGVKPGCNKSVGTLKIDLDSVNIGFIFLAVIFRLCL
ncbi:hypothetical protein scyTo_0018135 [Scyliorhinus torazame]|uniref:Uncharacterized protein n=1 Tax=Scyliorhinus torazame TaxID=75743 RepID=A0A401Q548_SCYTO|nr:hypothetical protein [Scyliorhinus torazame]